MHKPLNVDGRFQAFLRLFNPKVRGPMKISPPRQFLKQKEVRVT